MGNRRLGIFAFYEKNGIVDDYVIYLLQDLKECLEQLIIVCNGTLSEGGRQKLVEVADEIFVRENKGYDVGAFREVLLSYMGKDKIKSFDEVVLCNDTFFGPFVPFSTIFSEMEGRKLDFWGVSAQPESLDFWGGTNRRIPAFIQSFFLVIGKSMLSDDRFWEYWEGLEAENWNVTQVVINHEQYFTPYFESLGYCWDAYTDNSFFVGEPEQNMFTPYLVIPYELIKYGKCPFLKKKCVNGKDISQGMEADNGSFSKAMEYIRKSTEYNYELIINYMLKHCSKELIADKLKLSYILSAKEQEKECDYSRIGIVASIKNRKMRELLSLLLKEAADNMYIHLAEHTEILRQHDIEECMPQNVEYICVLQDGFFGIEEKPACMELSYYRFVYENLLASKSYIASVVQLFEQDAYLGVLKTPDVRFGALLNSTADSFENGSYWIKKQALKNRSEFYIGTLYQTQYAELEFINKRIILQSVLQLENINHKTTDFTSYFQNKLFDFCKGQKKIYLYGAGGVGIRTAHALNEEGIDFQGFIVSDGQGKTSEVLGHKVYLISEVSEREANDIGIIVAVEERLYDVITDTLKKHNMNHYFYSYF